MIFLVRFILQVNNDEVSFYFLVYHLLKDFIKTFTLSAFSFVYDSAFDNVLTVDSYGIKLPDIDSTVSFTAISLIDFTVSVRLFLKV